MMLRPSQHKTFKTRSMTSTTAVRSSKLKPSGRRRFAQLGLEHSEHRRLSRGRRKAPSLSLASLAGLWGAGLAVQAVAAQSQSIPQPDQQQQQQQPVAQRDQATAVAGAVAVRCPEQQQQQQQPAYVGESDGKRVRCREAVGVGWPEKTATADWSGEQPADRSCEDEEDGASCGKVVGACGCEQPAGWSEGSGGSAEVRKGSGSGVDDADGKGNGNTSSGIESRRRVNGGESTVGDADGDGNNTDNDGSKSGGSCSKSKVAAVAKPPEAAVLVDRPVDQGNECSSCSSRGSKTGSGSGSGSSVDDQGICEPTRSGVRSADHPPTGAATASPSPSPAAAAASPSPSAGGNGIASTTASAGARLHQAVGDDDDDDDGHLHGTNNDNSNISPLPGGDAALSDDTVLVDEDEDHDGFEVGDGEKKEGDEGSRGVDGRRREEGPYCDQEGQEGGGAREGDRRWDVARRCWELDEGSNREERHCDGGENGGGGGGGKGTREGWVGGGAVGGRGQERKTRESLEDYDFSRSTEENYASSEEGQFAERFREARCLLDYSYHSHYTLERQQVQDDILQGALRTRTPGSLERPWAVFTAGAMGAGKSHVMGLLGERSMFPMEAFVQVDPDRLRRELPEMGGYVKRDSGTAGSLTHKEAGLMAEILEETALLQGRNILVDGSMRDGAWYTLHVGDLRRRFPRLRVAIIHVWAPEEEVLSRAVRRGLQTGRVIPPTVLRETIQAVPLSVEALAPLADYCVRIDNIDIVDNVGDDDSSVDVDASDGVGVDAGVDAGSGGGHGRRANEVEQRHQHQQGPQHEGGSLAASSSSEVTAETEAATKAAPEAAAAAAVAAAAGVGGDACGREKTAETEVPLPVLATPGETWESFREMFSQEPS